MIPKREAEIRASFEDRILFQVDEMEEVLEALEQEQQARQKLLDLVKYHESGARAMEKLLGTYKAQVENARKALQPFATKVKEAEQRREGIGKSRLEDDVLVWIKISALRRLVEVWQSLEPTPAPTQNEEVK